MSVFLSTAHKEHKKSENCGVDQADGEICQNESSESLEGNEIAHSMQVGISYSTLKFFPRISFLHSPHICAEIMLAISNSGRNCADNEDKVHRLDENVHKLDVVIENQRKEIIRLYSVISSLKSKIRSRPAGASDRRFSLAQEKILAGKRRVRWSKEDIVKGLSIRPPA